MPPQYNNEELIKSIKRRILVPTSQLTFEDPDWCSMASDTLQDEVVPLIMSTREEYFVTYVDIPMPSNGIIAIPSEAVGAKLRSVCWVQANTNPIQLVNLPRMDLDVVAGLTANFPGPLSNTWGSGGFYLQGNDVHIWPNTAIPAGYTVRLYYYKRSLELAPPSMYGRVLSLNPMTSSVVLDRAPSEFTTGSIINTLSPNPNFKITNAASTITNVSSPTVELSSLEGIEVGDYMSLFGYSAIPQIPVEAHAYLAQLTAVMALESLGDNEGLPAAMRKAQELKKNLLIMTSSRVDGSPKKIIPPNGGVKSAASLSSWRGYR